ncbi:MAG: hypothetical protein A2664_04490 [Candidatus Taylorbacteria bacterium RIFCSPHIGHO2_01_FULL_46_22b]|uniref:Uncharacterized protein n=1 Tax=Candidatus Taylorbacteria bacterium RIFCSPHIGHO2_01_FULL_46_22b TaxID=1802301 RepID=A0A1G2M498_9BACT|nr:MAG: hypothetical protein A2664_04490 [Candidatus Taylorbacteria bacterium RIFCSPHIGHO2_01_FULL_46_22b]
MSQQLQSLKSLDTHGRPPWASESGRTVQVSGVNLAGTAPSLALRNGAEEMDTILVVHISYQPQRGADQLPLSQRGFPWIVSTVVVHPDLLSCTKWSCNFSTKDLRGAFGILHTLTSVMGKFYREHDWVNFPNKGSGLVGDTNASVFISSEIIEAVRSLIQCVR